MSRRNRARVLRLKQLSDPVALDGRDGNSTSEAIVDLIKAMDLAGGDRRSPGLLALLPADQHPRAADRGGQLSRQPSPIAKPGRRCHNHFDPFAPPLASQTDPATFGELFERLRRLNVPPAQVESLLQELDIRLVFTAHPTEIVRHTVRHKQRRVANLLQRLQSGFPAEQPGRGGPARSAGGGDPPLVAHRRTAPVQADGAGRSRFDPALLPAGAVRCDAPDAASPHLQPWPHYPDVQSFPQASFCTFGSWVGSDRDGNPSVTPEITWKPPAISVS